MVPEEGAAVAVVLEVEAAEDFQEVVEEVLVVEVEVLVVEVEVLVEVQEEIHHLVGRKNSDKIDKLN